MKLFARLKEHLTYLGIPGLFLIAFLDSAAVPMAGGPDAVLLLLAWQRPGLAWLIAVVASAGSLLGCLLLYRIGRVGGEKALARFSADRRDWVKGKLNRHAFSTVLVSVTAPPPFPTKLFVLAAGVFQINLRAFVSAIVVGRLFRYGLESYLAARFGDQAAAILRHRYPQIALVLLAVVVGAVLLKRLRRRRKVAHEPSSGT